MRILTVFLLLSSNAFCQPKITIDHDTSTYVHTRTWPHAKTKEMALILSNGTLIETFSKKWEKGLSLCTTVLRTIREYERTIELSKW
jgi:hypothetical protein